MPSNTPRQQPQQRQQPQNIPQPITPEQDFYALYPDRQFSNGDSNSSIAHFETTRNSLLMTRFLDTAGNGTIEGKIGQRLLRSLGKDSLVVLPHNSMNLTTLLSPANLQSSNGIDSLDNFFGSQFRLIKSLAKAIQETEALISSNPTQYNALDFQDYKDSVRVLLGSINHFRKVVIENLSTSGYANPPTDPFFAAIPSTQRVNYMMSVERLKNSFPIDHLNSWNNDILSALGETVQTTPFGTPPNGANVTNQQNQDPQIATILQELADLKRENTELKRQMTVLQPGAPLPQPNNNHQTPPNNPQQRSSSSRIAGF